MTSVLLDPEMYAAEAQQILTYDLHDGCGIDLAVYTEPPPERGPYSPRELHQLSFGLPPRGS